MRVRDYAALALAVVLVIAGLAFVYWPVALIAAGIAVFAAWYWLIEEDGER